MYLYCVNTAFLNVTKWFVNLDVFSKSYLGSDYVCGQIRFNTYGMFSFCSNHLKEALAVFKD